MEQRANFLALCLLDALEDEDPKMIEDVLSKYDVNPNIIIQDRGIAPLHYSCGMPNVQLAEKITAQFLERGGNPNICSEDNMTPLHVAAIHGRANITKMLLKHGAKLDVLDVDRKTPILYAIHECHFDVVKVMQDHIFEQKYQKKTQDLTNSNPGTPNPKPLKNNHLAINQMESKKFTPNRINYNYDVTSPYYINITHRRKPDPCACCPPKNNNEGEDDEDTVNKSDESSKNIFALTKENIKELSKDLSTSETNKSPVSLINAWREKVQRAKSKLSILEKFNDIDSLLSGIMENEELDFTNTLLELNKGEEDKREEEEKQKPKSFLNTSFGRIVKTIEDVPIEIEDSFHTVPDFNDSNFIRSPKNPEYIVQMTEAYVHTDDENGLVFYETKLLNNQINRETPKKKLDTPHDESITSASTNLTVPLDYETEALRAELTNFGDPPGPITKSTKKLYIKRLTKYKRNTSQMKAQFNANGENKTKFSVELDRTIRREENFQRISEYKALEQELVAYFQNNQNTKRLREGHIKQSFIYMLIDPRVSMNLPGESSFLTKFEIWKRFVLSIFYVGKGKTSRPYSHLYEAMKKFSKEKGIITEPQSKGNNVLKNINIETFKSPNQTSTDSKKLNRILDIWSNGKGVVCLHVFHNIIPTDAYTREAAIIDALSLHHLTNMKRGDYYGPTQSWTMRAKKCLGVALLYKAMQIFVAEGESQLSPSDLI